MEIRDLKRQYQYLKHDIDNAIQSVLDSSQFISGAQIAQLEQQLADYAGVKHCITCGNGTDALYLAVVAWGIGEGDAVFVPDLTFVSSAEIVSLVGGTPIFVNVDADTFNISPDSLEKAIQVVLSEGKLTPRAIVAVDLYGQPADYDRLVPIAQKYGLMILEDGAQGFGGSIRDKKACSFGEISATSFFPAKPLGCYGDGGAVFTNDDNLDALIRSLQIHGKGKDKYDNVRVGVNSRLDTLQAAILQVKLDAFIKHELDDVNRVAAKYTELLDGTLKTPTVPDGFISSWAAYTILLDNKEQRDGLQMYLKSHGIPSKIYYSTPMHMQKVYSEVECKKIDLSVTENICDRVLSLPIHPYLTEEEQDLVVHAIEYFLKSKGRCHK